MTIPGLTVTLVALAALDRLGLWLRGRSGLSWYRDGHRAAPAPGLDELQAVFYSSKRHTIDRRRTQTAGDVTTSASSKPSATKSPSNAPPDPQRQSHPGFATLHRGAAARPV